MNDKYMLTNILLLNIILSGNI